MSASERRTDRQTDAPQGGALALQTPPVEGEQLSTSDLILSSLEGAQKPSSTASTNCTNSAGPRNHNLAAASLLRICPIKHCRAGRGMKQRELQVWRVHDWAQASALLGHCPSSTQKPYSRRQRNRTALEESWKACSVHLLPFPCLCQPTRLMKATPLSTYPSKSSRLKSHGLLLLPTGS